MSDGVKFIRVHGKVVPLRGKGSAPQGVSKRYGAKRDTPKAKSLGVKTGAAIGFGIAAGTMLGKAVAGTKGKLSFGAALASSAIGALAGSIKYTSKGKGESNKQLSKRIAKKA